jgi:hypothetical protein
MIEENINSLISVLFEHVNECDYQNQILAKKFCKKLEEIKVTIPTSTELENLQKDETVLETKYENYYDIGNYFDQLYVEIKKEIHENEVKQIREKNRRKNGYKL